MKVIVRLFPFRILISVIALTELTEFKFAGLAAYVRPDVLEHTTKF